MRRDYLLGLAALDAVAEAGAPRPDGHGTGATP